jgi:2-dehydro-3-deoxyglucarate aldolase/4-hydroxy-2-oxoheptanedioate aldolase
VDGIDVLWIGQNDLTASLGIPGQFQHAGYLEAVERVVEAARSHGKVAGMAPPNVEFGYELLAQGFRMIGLGDIWLYQRAVREALDGLRATARGADPR